MDLFHNEVSNIDIGSRLHQLRTERNKSLRSLARTSGLSTNALSMIERGRTSPSVSTLYKIADALGVPITAFFRMEPPKQDIVFRKAAERKRVSISQGIWEGLGGEAFTGRVEPFILTLEVGGDSGPYGMLHSGSEFVLCLEGQIEYRVEGQQYFLDAGDALLFAAQLRHCWRNTGNKPASMLIVLSGFDQGERPSEFHLSSGGKGEQVEDETGEDLDEAAPV
jgi:transcriptional regulator with XRE-family HTH domain